MHRRGGKKEVFHGNKEVVELINSVQFDWDKIVETLIDFLNNGAGNMLSSTLTAAKKHYQRSFNICYSFFICNLYFAAEEKAWDTGEKGTVCIRTKRSCGGCGGSLFPYLQHIFKLPDRTVPGGCDSRKHVRIGHDNLPAAVCTASGNLYRIYRTDTDLWSISWLCGGSIFNLHGRSDEGTYVHRVVSCASADRREPDLSACGR